MCADLNNRLCRRTRLPGILILVGLALLGACKKGADDAPSAAAANEEATSRPVGPTAEDFDPFASAADSRPADSQPTSKREDPTSRSSAAEGDPVVAAESRPSLGSQMMALLDDEGHVPDSRPYLEAGAFEIEVDGTEAAARVRLRGRKIPLADLFGRLAERLEVRLELQDPGLAETLTQRDLDLDLPATPVAEALRLIECAVDLNLTLDFQTRRLDLKPWPKSGTKVAASYHRNMALDAIRRSTALRGSVREGEAVLLLDGADMAAQEGLYDEARSFCESVLQRHRNSPLAPRACLLGARYALDAKKPGDARRLASFFLETYRDHADTRKIEYLLARTFRDQNRDQDAVLLLERINRAVTRGGVDERDGIVADLMLAETYHKLGDAAKAVEVLRRIRGRNTRAHQDLLARIPFYTGLCLQTAERFDEAVVELAEGAHRAPTERLRALALLHLAEAYASKGAPFEALAAVKTVQKIGIPADQTVRALEVEGRAAAGLGLDRRAVRAFVGAIEAVVKAAGPTAEKRETVRRLMRKIAAMHVDAADFDTAREVLERLRDLDGLSVETSYHIALCRYRLGDAAAALRELESVPDDLEDERLAADVRSLRGDCQLRLARFENAIRTFRKEEHP